MKASFLVLATVLAFTAAAHARTCGPNARAEILKGLQDRAADPSMAQQEREEAVFVESLVVNEPHLHCNFNSGFAGNIYDLQTATHQIHINFVGSKISNLLTKRTRFN